MFFLTYLELVMSSDSDNWPKTMSSKINSLNINQVWTMIEAPMGMIQQVAIRDAYSKFCYCHTESRKAISSGRANAFVNSDRN